MKKNLLIISLSLILLLSIFALRFSGGNSDTVDLEGNSLVLSLDIGEGRGKLAYSSSAEEMERFGPESFAVNDEGTIVFLDSVEKQIEMFDEKGVSLGTIDLPDNESYYDIEVNSKNNIIVVSYKGKVFEISPDGTILGQTKIGAVDINFCMLYRNKDRNVVFRNLLNGSETNLETKAVAYSYDSITRVDGRSDNKTQVFSYQGKDITINYDHQAGPTYPLKVADDGAVLFVETEVEGDILYLETRVSKYKDGNRVGIALAEPIAEYEIVANKMISVDEYGHVYQMVCKKDKVEVYRLKFWEI